MDGPTAASRRRPLACDPCRKRKLRCDRHFPCSMCVRSRREECSYPPIQRGATTTPQHFPSDSQRKDGGGSGIPRSAPMHPSPFSPSSRVDQQSSEMEVVSSLAAGKWHNSVWGSIYISGKTHDPYIAETLSTWRASTRTSDLPAGHSQSESANKPAGRDQWILSLAGLATPIKGIICKGQYVGQSHWLQSMMLVPKTLTWVHQEPTQPGTELYSLVQECKTLARQAKLQRQPQGWDLECGKHFPSKAVCDRLLELYISNFETFHRIVHIQTLISEYEQHWLDPTITETFVVLKIQLCLAIGCYLYDDTFSLRPIVEQWIHEAKAMVMTLEKPPSSIIEMQLLCLLYFTRLYYKGKEGPPVWISGATIYQAAFSIGLQIDPGQLPKVSSYDAEVRKRLWMTVLEIQIESSFEAGTPPVLALDDHDLVFPSNLNDDQLDYGNNDAPVAHSTNVYTNTSLQILFGRSLMLRLRIVKLVNNSRSEVTYGEILRLTSELEDATRVVMSQIATFSPAVTPFQRRWCELLIRRYFLILHLPYMQVGLQNPLYHFSRKVCVDNAIRLSFAFATPRDGDETLETLRTEAKIEYSCDEFLRFHYCTAGFIRTTQLQCIFVLGAELLTVAEEDAKYSKSSRQGEGQSSSDGNLQTVQLHVLLRQAINCVVHRLRAGLSNARDYATTLRVLIDAEAAMPGSVSDDIRHKQSVESFRFAASLLRERIETELPLSSIVMKAPAANHDMDLMDNLWFNDIEETNWDDLTSKDGQT